MPKKNPMTMLKEDHKRVKELLEKLAGATDRAVKKRQDLLAQIEHEIKLHMQIEEEIFYPALDEAVSSKEDKKLVPEAKEEHHAADVVLKDIMNADPSSIAFGGKAKVLKELIEHHMQEEEKVMFARARDIFETEELEQLAQRMTSRKTALEGSRSTSRLKRAS
jgi:iron-sulfur cluster repair protein YtfE (RIC family)